ncbi:1-phosphofructokinase family hexose kinase [Paenibacillus alkalitolerans]|uniref:1-phosphofructokinase family hexose kinase n=1 Tax=Paenibacillus alkalitolerans TaxID=2799335 RepID=UPI0018F3BBC7|nr:1-phosphofructokinase family hexose kinase [Paenibacillus alkalitolerans]
MITTVTLNAAIDKTYYVDTFVPGRVSRADRVLAVPGGKGLNVARVIRTLGYETLATGIVGGNNGNFIRTGLDRIGIAHDFVTTIGGESRLCLNIISQHPCLSTEILEPGPKVSEEETKAVFAKVSMLAAVSDIVVLSGSLPAGMPSDTYKLLIERIREQGALPFLDSSTAALRNGLEAKPFLVKPNEDEAESLLGVDVRNEESLVKALRHRMTEGIDCIVVTRGAAGSIAGFRGQCYRVHAPVITPLNTVGCGDSFVAGMAVGFQRQWEIEQILTFATAVSAANALTEHAGEVYGADVERLSKEIRIERI